MKVVNKYKDVYDVYIGRGSKWGNPFKIGAYNSDTHKSPMTRALVISMYEEYIRDDEILMASLHELDGKVLGCFCKPKACHGDVLVKLRKEQLI